MKRRRVALSLTILWIVGFELLPWAHIALHAHLAPHHHDANGADIIDDHDALADDHAPEQHDVVDRDADDHDDHHDDDDLDSEVDEHGVPVRLAASKADEDREAAANGEAHLRAALEHGAHSLAHHGIAVPVPAPVMTKPLPVDRRPITLEIAEQPIWRSAAIPEAAARGPPVLA